MHTIPVERIRPQRVGEQRQAIAIERVRPMRAADVLAAATLAAINPDEIRSTMPDEPAPTRKNPFPFDRSALVPTGSRGVENRLPTASQPWQPSSRAAGLVPTPLPTGNNGSTAVASTPTQIAPQAASPSTSLAVPTVTPVISISQNASTQALTPSAQPVSQPVAQAPAKVIEPAQTQPAQVVTAPAEATPVEASQPVKTAQVDTTPATNTGFKAVATTTPVAASQPTTATPVTAQATPAKKLDRAALASMFPAPEGWYDSPRKRTVPAGWNLVATPLPTVVEAQKTPVSNPVTTSEALTPMQPMSPMTSSLRSIEAAEESEAASKATEPTAGLIEPAYMPTVTETIEHAQPKAEPTMSLRTVPADAAEIEAARSEAILTELRRKAITREVYEQALARLAERREGGAELPDKPLMAGDSLGVQIARSAGYID